MILSKDTGLIPSVEYQSTEERRPLSNLKLLMKILRLKGMTVTTFTFQDHGRELHRTVKPYKNGCRCPQCNRRGRIVASPGVGCSWEDLTLIGSKILLWFAPREIESPTHGRVQEQTPWAARYARITYRLEWRIGMLCRSMTQKAAAEILHMARSTLSDLLHRIPTRTRDGHSLRGLRGMGADEISYCKGRKFATIVYDLERAQVVWVGAGKGRETIDPFFSEALSEYPRSPIRCAGCDMSRAYTEAIKPHYPNATLIIDHFHVTKALNEAVDEVRKEQWRAMAGEKRKALTGLRWLLYRDTSTRTKGQTRALNRLRHCSRRIHRAWVLKDEFAQFWGFTHQAAAEKFPRRRMTSALRSRIPSLRTCVSTLKAHFDNILAFVEHNLTNAVAEELNHTIKILKNRASGYPNLDAFTDIIYLVVGGFDIPTHVPSNLRTL